MKLDTRTKELIAVGASVTANCQPCLEYHVDLALKHGVDMEEVAEAVEVGKMVRKGASAKYDKFAASLVATPPAAPAAETGCGCSS